MNLNDYNGWTPRRPSPGFARRTVDAMLTAAALEEQPADESPVQAVAAQPAAVAVLPHKRESKPEVEQAEPRRKHRLGGLATILAAALIATSAVGMYRAQHMSVPTVSPALPVVTPPVMSPVSSPAGREVALEPEAIAATPPRPRASAKPQVAPPAVAPKYVPTPRCSCLSDVAVCGCIEP